VRAPTGILNASVRFAMLALRGSPTLEPQFRRRRMRRMTRRMTAPASDPAAPVPSALDRRALLEFLGLGAATAWLGGCTARGELDTRAANAFVDAFGAPRWTPLRPPLPTALYPQARATYVVLDELQVAAGFRAEPLALWGERFGAADGEIEFGFNADFVGVVPIAGAPGEFFVVVNHEFISARPWMQGFQRVKGRELPALRLEFGADGAAEFELGGARSEALSLDPERLDAHARAELHTLAREALGDLGVSILHCRQRADGGFEVVRDSARHRRIGGCDAKTPTHSNCSGGVTPWGGVLTCEENVQDYVPEFVDARGGAWSGERRVFRAVGPAAPFAEPLEFEGLGACLGEPQDGRDFGWVGHVDPGAGVLRKLRALGRFRHENVALRCVAGEPLVAYMGDDRRGGHVWKFVSRARVERSEDPANVELLEDGVLYAARLDADGSGEWIALEPRTPLAAPQPEHCAGGHVWLPDRRLDVRGEPRGGHVAISAAGAKLRGMGASEWCKSLELACGKPFARLTLGDLVWPPRGAPLDAERARAHVLDVLRLDAYAMANAIGATPTARPEDLELHPHDGSVFVAFSDAVSTSGDGSPDVRVFPEARGLDSRRYGCIVRLEEKGGEPAARSFQWRRFVSCGELVDGGAGFACPDNLTFDPQGNLWVLTDLPGAAMHAAVRREGDSAPGTDRFAGVFGSSALFMIPTAGEYAGIPHAFAIGPAECELCGVAFSPDGRALFLSVQHPGEQHGVRGGAYGLPAQVERTLRLATHDGGILEQSRTVPLGSNWPSGRLGDPPRPGVVCIRRVD
jgi:secreted PhoX family phosphatase